MPKMLIPVFWRWSWDMGEDRRVGKEEPGTRADASRLGFNTGEDGVGGGVGGRAVTVELGVKEEKAGVL